MRAERGVVADDAAGVRRPILDVTTNRLLWSLALAQLPVSLYEEKRSVVTALVLAKLHDSSRSAAIGAANLYALELLFAGCVAGGARLSTRTGRLFSSLTGQQDSRQQAAELLRLVKLLLVAASAHVLGLLAIFISMCFEPDGQFTLRMYWSGQVLYSLGMSLRNVVLPTLSTCFPVDGMNRLNAYRQSIDHLGAVLGGLLVVTLSLRTYFMCVTAGTLLGFAAIGRAVAGVETSRLSCSGLVTTKAPTVVPVGDFAVGGVQVIHGPDVSQPLTTAWKQYSLLLVARFVQAWGLTSTSYVVMLPFLRSRFSPEQLGPFRVEQMLVLSSTTAHLVGFAINMSLGWRRRVYYDTRHVSVAAALYAVALMSFGSVFSPYAYLSAAALLSAARSFGKATSDAIAMTCARDLGADKAAALQARKIAFKLGLLCGKYAVAPLIAYAVAASINDVADERHDSSSLMFEPALAFNLIFGLGAALYVLGAALHIPACFYLSKR